MAKRSDRKRYFSPYKQAWTEQRKSRKRNPWRNFMVILFALIILIVLIWYFSNFTI